MVWRNVRDRNPTADVTARPSTSTFEQRQAKINKLARQGDVDGITMLWRTDSEHWYEVLRGLINPNDRIDAFL